MAYSLDFRKRVLARREREGLTLHQTADLFGIGIATLTRWVKRVEPRPYTRLSVRKIDLDKLRQDVIDFPDSYQYERAERFDVCPKAIWQALKKIGVTYKKSPQTSKSMRRQTAILPKED